jgi:predicted DNA-binding transcriptional regulator YafY
MTDRITKTQRWLDLIALLLNRKLPLTVEQIMERIPAYAQAAAGEETRALASARRMFERDKDELRAAGIPVETVRYEINYGLEVLEGYRITRRDFYLPYLQVLWDDPGDASIAMPRPYLGLPEVHLSPGEIAPAMDALRHVSEMDDFPFADAAASALQKLAFDVDYDELTAPPVLPVGRAGADDLLERLRTLTDALLARKRVTFTYHGIARGEPTERDVAPYGIFYNRDWYMVGHDATRDAVRVFRASRIEDPQPNTKQPKTADYAVPVNFDLQQYVDRDAWELGEPGDAIDVDVLFSFPRSIRAERSGEGTLVEERHSQGAVRRFRVSQADPFLRWLLSLQGEAVILRPEHLREELRAMAREALALYGAWGGEDD